METNTQNTTQNATNTTAGNTGNTGNTGNNNAGSNGNGQHNFKLNDLVEMATPYLGMLQGQAGRVPDMLKTAGTSVASSYKRMSTTTKVVTAGALAVGAALLVNNMRKNKGATSTSGKRTNKK